MLTALPGGDDVFLNIRCYYLPEPERVGKMRLNSEIRSFRPRIADGHPNASNWSFRLRESLVLQSATRGFYLAHKMNVLAQK